MCILDMGKLFSIWDRSQVDCPNYPARAMDESACALSPYQQTSVARHLGLPTSGIKRAHYGSISIFLFLSKVDPLFLCLRAVFTFSQ